MSTRDRNSARKIERERRRNRAMELRLAGGTYREIGELLGVSANRAWKIVHDEMLKQRQAWRETVEEVRDLELARLDRMTFGVYEQARKGHLASVDRMLKIMERRARLLGLDATPDPLSPLNDELVILRTPLRGPSHGPAVVVGPPASDRLDWGRDDA